MNKLKFVSKGVLSPNEVSSPYRVHTRTVKYSQLLIKSRSNIQLVFDTVFYSVPQTMYFTYMNRCFIEQINMFFFEVRSNQMEHIFPFRSSNIRSIEIAAEEKELQWMMFTEFVKHFFVGRFFSLFLPSKTSSFFKLQNTNTCSHCSFDKQKT